MVINPKFLIIFYVIVQLFTYTMVLKCLFLGSRKAEKKSYYIVAQVLLMQRTGKPSVNLTL